MSGRYTVDPEPLGQGGMAAVHRAEATSSEGFRRPVAIKYIHEALATQPDFEAQFRAEAHLIALLRHPNIVHVLDFDRDETGRLFLVMELVEGTDLRRIRDHGPLPIGLAVHVVAEVLKGLVYAHAAQDEQGRAIGLVHRDLSPQNVLVSWDGTVKITDFGIAQGLAGSTTRTGVVKGNAGYMSPEQIEGNLLDARSDLYAVGVLLHELLVGEPLFARPGRPTRSILSQILLGRAEPPVRVRPDVPQPLSDFVMRLLGNDMEARPVSAEAALRSLLDLGLLPTAATLDFAAHLQALRRAGEHPTVVEHDAAAAPMVTASIPAADTVAFDTQPGIAAIDGIEVAKENRWLPWVTVGLGLVVAALGARLFWASPAEPESLQGTRVVAPAPRPAATMAVPIDAGERPALDAEVLGESVSPKPRPQRVRDRTRLRTKVARARNALPSVPTAPPDAGIAPVLLPYTPTDGLLPYGGD